jgi:drug/metabolite transporter (DMT)-like permease
MNDGGRRTDAWRVAAALLAIQLLFGLHYPLAKLLLLEISPRAWALVRVGAAALLLLAAMLVWRRPFPRDRAVWARLALYSVFGVVINQLCFVEGLARTSASHSAVLNTTIPVWTLLFAVLLGGERLRARQLLPFGLALAGITLVLGQEASAGTARWGDLLTLVNALSYGLFLALSKRVLDATNTLAATTLLFLFGGLGLLAPCLPALLALEPAQVSAWSWGLGLFIVVFPTVGAYLLTFWALARAESTVVAFFVFLQPVIAGTLAWVLLGERPDREFLLGALLIFVAVWLALTTGGQRQAR